MLLEMMHGVVRTGEIVPWIKCLLCRHYDLNLDPGMHVKQTECNPSAGIGGQAERDR